MKNLKDLKAFIIVAIFSLILLFISEFNYLKIGILLIFIGSIFYSGYSFIKIKKEAKEEKIKIFEILNNIIESIEIPIVFYDDKLKILNYNKSFCEFCELKENFIGKTLETWITKNEAYFKLSLIFFPSITADNIKILEKEPYEKIEVSSKEKIFLNIITHKTELFGFKINFKIIIDRSEIILKDKEKEEFLQLLSHNLKTPLNQIKWILESLNKEKLDMPELIDDALIILDRSLILTEYILISAQIEAKKLKLNLEENNIEDIIKSCSDLFKKEIEEKNLKINIIIEENIKKFLFDKSILFLVIYPIFQNAVDYNKKNGLINIEVKRIEEKSYAEITIEDTGIGMDEEEKKNLFKKYFRGSKASEIKPAGFGIGLYLVKKIAEFHKIDIQCESEKNVGTKFYIYIPLAKEIYV